MMKLEYPECFTNKIELSIKLYALTEMTLFNYIYKNIIYIQYIQLLAEVWANC